MTTAERAKGRWVKETAKKVAVELTKTTLAVLAAGSVVAFSVLMPGLAKTAASFVSRREYEQRRAVKRIVRRLGKRGLVIAVRRAGEEEYFKITSRGRRELARLELQGQHLPQGKRWDAKWRVVVFDVKEKRRWMRDRIRFYLKQTGFVLLQNSVWIYPYDCEEVIELIRTALRLREEAIYLVCQRFAGDDMLCRHFGLAVDRKH